MIPFAASAQRYSEWLRILLREDVEAPFPKVAGKENMRTVITGDRMLSIPVEGGAARLKKANVDFHDISLSSHGRWQEVHLGALKAAYGRSPYFPIIFPEIEEVYRYNSSGSLVDFNMAIHRIITKYSGIEPHTIATLKKELADDKGRISRLARERESVINRNYSILEALFRLGRETIFILV